MTREALYVRLVALYPRSFRREYEEEMMYAFSELSRETRSPMQFWSIVLPDVIRSAAREHFDAWTCGLRRVALHWVAACTVGALASGVVGWALFAAYGWLFPLDPSSIVSPVAVNLSVAVCGVLIGVVIGGVQSLALRRFLGRPVSWVAATSTTGAAGILPGLFLANWSGLEVVRFGYFVALAFVGSSFALWRSRLVRADRTSAGRWIGWNAGAVPAAVAAGLASEFFYRALVSSWPGVLGFLIFPAVVGLVVGVVTVWPLTRLLSRDEDVVADPAR